MWVPGSGSLSTWDFAAKHDHCYCFLSYFGNNLGKTVMDGFWEFVDTSGLDANPYRAGFLQLVAVGETDAQAEKEYAEHIKYFYDKCLHIPPNYLGPPGHQDFRSLEHGIRSGTAARTAQTDAPAGHDVQGLRRRPVRHLRQPGDGARPAAGRDQEAARGQPDGAARTSARCRTS